MRSRNLKPSLFTNELLGSADPLYTILFEGLWCEADREGRLEDRPLRLCALIFPFRRNVTPKRVDAMLQWLHDHEFIVRYTCEGEVGEKTTVDATRKFIQVRAFTKHQNPHKNERPSAIPALSSSQHQPRPVRAQESNEPKSESLRLNPSSLNSDSHMRNPDSHLRNPSSADSAAGSSTGHAAAGEPASAQGRSTRRSRGNGKTGKEPEELRQDALKLSSAGMQAPDIAHALTQYGVTLDQVRDWVGVGASAEKVSEGAPA